MGSGANAAHREPWNKGRIVGQKVPFKPKDIWALRVRLQMEGRLRELALSTLESTVSCAAATNLKVRDICHSDQVATRAVVVQRKDLASGAVRDHAGDTRRFAEVDQARRAQV